MIGITFARQENPDIPLSPARDKHCSFMGKAREGEITQIHVDQVSCPLARYYLGLPTPSIAETSRTLVRWNDALDEAGARRYLECGWRLEEAGPYIIYFPCPHGALKPDVIVEVGTPAGLSRIAAEFSRRTGERLVPSISGIGAACGECTVYPLVMGRASVSLGCGGSRPAMGLGEAELLLAAPRGTAMFDILCQRAGSAQAGS